MDAPTCSVLVCHTPPDRRETGNLRDSIVHELTNLWGERANDKTSEGERKRERERERERTKERKRARIEPIILSTLSVCGLSNLFSPKSDVAQSGFEEERERG